MAEPNNSSDSEPEEIEESLGSSSEDDEGQYYLTSDQYKNLYTMIIKELEDNGERMEMDGVLRQLELVMSSIHQDTTSNRVHDTRRVAVDHTEYFLEEALPAIMRTLLGKRFNSNQILQLNEFFHSVLQFLIDYIVKDGSMNLLETLRRIFDPERFFYLYTNSSSIGSNLSEIESEEFIYAAPSSFSTSLDMHQHYGFHGSPHYMGWNRAPLLLINNINYFGNEGGFEAILTRISNVDDKISMYRLKSYIKIIYQIRDLFTNKFRSVFIPKLQEIVFDYFLSLNENELRTLDKNDFEEATKMVQMMMEQSSVYQNRIEQVMETFYLEFAFKCFKSTILEKRIHGMSYLDEVIEMAENREKSIIFGMEEHPYQHYSQYRKSKFIDIPFLLNWMEKHKIIEELFSSSSHFQLIKKSTKLIIFLAQHKSLKEREIDILWSAITDKHESIISATLDILSESIGHFDDSSLLFIVNKLKSLSISDWNTKFINLCMELLKCNNIEVKTLVFDLLYSVINNESISTETQNVLLSKITKVFEASWFRSRKQDFIIKLIDNIKHKTNTLQSIQLLKYLLESYSSNESLFENRKSIIQHLFEENIVDILLDDLFTYIEQKNSPIIQTSLSLRLEFIYYILINGDFILTKEELSKLWEYLIVKDSTLSFNDYSLNWFASLTTPLSKYQHVLAFIFENLLCRLKFSTISIAALKCFIKYFNCHNQCIGNLNDKEEIIRYPLSGIESVWSIALNATDEHVAKECILKLIDYNQKYSSDCKEDITILLNNYMDSLFNHISQCVNVDNNVNQVNRLIDILKITIDSNPPSYCTPPHFRGKRFKLNIQANMKDNVNLLITICPNDPFSLLCSIISSQLGEKDNVIYEESSNYLFQIVSADNTSNIIKIIDSVEDKPINQYGITNATQLVIKKKQENSGTNETGTTISEEEFNKLNQVIEIFPVTHEMAYIALQRCRGSLEETVNRLVVDEHFLASIYDESANSSLKLNLPKQNTSILNTLENEEKKTKTVFSPCMIIYKTPKYFEQLFKLLEIEDKSINKNKLWSIIQCIPNSEYLKESILHSNSSSQWNNFFSYSGNSKYKLLYCLEILWSLLDSSSFDIFSSKLFIEHGGFTHMFQLHKNFAIQSEFANEESTERTTYVLLSKIMYYFIENHFEDIQPILQDANFIYFITTSLTNLVKYSYLEGVNSVLDLFVLSASKYPLFLSLFCKYDKIEEFIYFMLYEVDDLNIRKSVSKSLQHLVDLKHTDFITWLSKFLLKYLSKIETPKCESYFDILLSVLSITYHSSQLLFKHTDLLDMVLDNIMNRPIIESYSNNIEDKLLIGYLQLLLLITKEDSPLIINKSTELIYVIYSYLFADNKNNETIEIEKMDSLIKCKSNATRKISFKVLTSLAKMSSENLETIISILIPQHDSIINRKNKQSITSLMNEKTTSKSITGYVGLKNLGATCYVNSIMQQFFMIPYLRSSILQTVLNSNVDNLVYQIQIMFSYLISSNKQYFSPIEFCQTFKDWEGNSINVNLQQDALEFFNLLCDRMESNLKGLKEEKLLNNTFIGTLNSRFTCKECLKYSDITEPFYSISLDIKGNTKLEQAFKSYIKEEVLEGEHAYSCQYCAKKVTATKQSSIKELSPTVIIHLKRFEFDIDRQVNHKLLDYFEFPLSLDIYPYTLNGIINNDSNTISKEDYLYDLVGVVVHSGSADSGHYYSFIQDRFSNKWLKFDDNLVSSFSIENLQDECFGGKQLATTQHSSVKEQSKMKNAYMLVYQRRNYDNKTLQSVSSAPVQLQQQIQDENYQIFKDKLLLDTEYFEFLKSLIDNYSINNENNKTTLNIVQFFTTFVFETILALKQEVLFKHWMSKLQNLFMNSLDCSKWLLTSLTTTNRNWFRELLIEHGEDYVRSSFASLLLEAIKLVSSVETEDMDNENYNSIQNISLTSTTTTTTYSKSTVVNFMDNYLSMLEFTRQHWRKFVQYFWLLKEFMLLGYHHRNYLSKRYLVGSLVDYYMGPFSPNLKVNQQRVRIGDSTSSADLRYFMICMSIMVTNHSTDGIIESNKRPTTLQNNNNKTLLPLHESEKKLLFHREFFSSLIKQGYYVESTQEIVAHLCFEDINKTKWILEIIMEGICRANWDACEYLFAAFTSVFTINDSLKYSRVQLCLNSKDNGMLDIIYHYRDRYPKFTHTCIKFLSELSVEYPLCAAYLYNSKQEWWPWLHSYLVSRVQAEDTAFASLLYFFEALVENTLQTKFNEDYTQLWNQEIPTIDHKLFIHKI